MKRAALLLAGALTPATALAAPGLSAVWSDHVVVQRGQPIVVEGTTIPTETVSATLGSEHMTATANRLGQFTLTFPARQASSDPLTLTVTAADGTSTSVNDILVGATPATGESKLSSLPAPGNFAKSPGSRFLVAVVT